MGRIADAGSAAIEDSMLSATAGGAGRSYISWCDGAGGTVVDHRTRHTQTSSIQVEAWQATGTGYNSACGILSHAAVNPVSIATGANAQVIATAAAYWAG